jgi:hypothetical protein
VWASFQLVITLYILAFVPEKNSGRGKRDVESDHSTEEESDDEELVILPG